MKRSAEKLTVQELEEEVNLRMHLYAVDLEAFCLLYGLFQVIKILLRFRTKLQQCNFFSGNGWRMALIPLPLDSTATKRWWSY